MNATLSEVDPLAGATLLVVTLALAGAGHTFWLKSPLSRKFAVPLDRGLRLRGKRIFGEHKMWRGLMAMPLLAALLMALPYSFRSHLPPAMERGLWNLDGAEGCCLGFFCGLFFMLGELPNSFLKRQLGIDPGKGHSQPILSLLFMALDRIDSELAVLIFLTLILPVSLSLWFWFLLFGIVIHLLFSLLLYRLGVKGRAL